MGNPLTGCLVLEWLDYPAHAMHVKSRVYIFEEKGLIKMIDGSVVKHEPNLVSSKDSNTVASVYFMEKKRWQG